MTEAAAEPQRPHGCNPAAARESNELRRRIEAERVTITQFAAWFGLTDREAKQLVAAGIIGRAEMGSRFHTSTVPLLSAIQGYTAHLRDRLTQAEALVGTNPDAARSALALKNQLIGTANGSPAVEAGWLRVLAAIVRTLASLPERTDAALPLGLTKAEREAVAWVVRDTVAELARGSGQPRVDTSELLDG